MGGHEAPTLRLAHDIAVQFRYLPSDEGEVAVANHIRMSWDPRMRRQLAAEIDTGGVTDPLVLGADSLLRGPAAVRSLSSALRDTDAPRAPGE